jgi:uncharacterized Zn-binding protein involved in type VI secretion
MPGASRVGDADSGHGTYTADTVKSGSGNVIINGISAARTGDPHGQHINKVEPFDIHSAICGTGSGSVFINEIPAFRIGDPVDAATQIGGSSSVIIGG